MVKKEITFIYMDSAEKSIMENLAVVAQNRGYKTVLTRDKFAKCEIGVYCQHINFPQFSKISIIMLHDIIQQYGNWPDIWMREPWNKYDIGILPSNQWVNNWVTTSKYYYARPRHGVYLAGWPKADQIKNLDKEKFKKIFYKKYGLDLNKKTILYAPAWENDNKQDDFVQAMLKLDVNILIKQYNATPEINLNQYNEIQRMYNLHKDDRRVTIMHPRNNIFEAILASDILVSEESSTMAEALMLGIPAISVSNWLIPDVIPSRYPECNYNFVIMTKKEQLTECVKGVLCNYTFYKAEAEKQRDLNFSNLGKSSSIIIDIIDDLISNRDIRYKPIIPQKPQKLSLKKYIKHIAIITNREMTHNYSYRFKAIDLMWNTLRRIKKTFIQKPFED